MSDQRSSPTWYAIHEIHGEGGRALVDATRATVVYDDRNPYPYELSGEVVGHVVSIDDEGFTLAGFTFRTRVLWENAKHAQRREEAA